jgi:NAD(P)-dependent dehydrogenase (short-subunit alcohol dehydrogenase family)
MGPIEGLDAVASYRRMMALNLDSAFFTFRAMVARLRHRGGGWIVGIGSKAIHAPPAQMGAYVASKAALVALCQSLSEELKHDAIHVNVILPSTIDTPANRAAMGEKNAHKWVTPDDLASATMYLCSEAGRAHHGTTLELYGLS